MPEMERVYIVTDVATDSHPIGFIFATFTTEEPADELVKEINSNKKFWGLDPNGSGVHVFNMTPNKVYNWALPNGPSPWYWNKPSLAIYSALTLRN